MGVFSQIRSAAREVTERARFVRIDDESLLRLSQELESLASEPGSLDPDRHYLGHGEATVAYIVALDTLNFGSGWFPFLKKRPGCSGYFTMAAALKDRFESKGPWSPEELEGMDRATCAAVFGQDPTVPEAAELMGHFAEALRQLGALVRSRCGGCFVRLIEQADGSAEELVGVMGELPYYRDVSRYHDFEVPLYKRAQLLASDLSLAFGAEGPGCFRDLDSLTIFADNLVPHVLRREGVLRYDDGLAARIDREETLEAGSPEEVEIRAVALHAVERMVSAIRERGGDADAGRLDHLLWNRGQLPAMKAHPRHRARSVYY